MKWRQIDHRDGSKSIHLIPESVEERAHLNQALSTWPGGCLHDVEGTASRIDYPTLSKDGQQWPDDAEVKEKLFTRRIYLGHCAQWWGDRTGM